MEDELRAKLMTNASNDDGYSFKYNVIQEVEFMFGAMMRGEDMMVKLQPYLPLTVDKINGYLNYNYAEWRQSFESTLDSSESARKGVDMHKCTRLAPGNK